MRTSGISRALVSALLIIGLGALVIAGSGGGFARAESLLDWDVPNGHFFTQTSPEPGKGYIVGNFLGRRLWDEFQRLGGVPILGYPISNDFVWDGFRTQLFQRTVFQWRPEADQVYFINVFDELHDKGFDDWLLAFKSIPKPLDPSFDQGKSWNEIMRDRLALLDEEPAFKEKYQEVRGRIDPLLLYGLPTSRVTDMGNHYAMRLQRAVFQLWKEDVPWARAGEITVALGGTISVEAGLYKPEVTRPSDPYGQPPTPTPLPTPTATSKPIPTPDPNKPPKSGIYVGTWEPWREPGRTIEIGCFTPSCITNGNLAVGPYHNLAFSEPFVGRKLTVRVESIEHRDRRIITKPDKWIARVELFKSFVGEVGMSLETSYIRWFPPPWNEVEKVARVAEGPIENWPIQYGQYFLFFPGTYGNPFYKVITYTITISD